MPTTKLVGKDRATDARLRREYQVSLGDYEKVFNFQGRVCAVCKEPVPSGKPRLAVDHRHRDGILRGLLCWRCNRAIGAFHRFWPDAVEMLQAAAEYLKNPPFTVVFGTNRFAVPGKVGTKKRAKLLKQLAQGTKSSQRRNDNQN